MREVLTPALWACAWHAASMASTLPAPANARRIAVPPSARRHPAADHSVPPRPLRRTAAEAARMLCGISFGKCRKRLARFGGIAAPGFGIAREPRCPRQIDGVDERGFFGIVRAERSRGQRLRLGDLPIEVVGAQADELERIEHEALVKARFQKRKTRARRIGCRGRKPKRFLDRGARQPVAADRVIEGGRQVTLGKRLLQRVAVEAEPPAMRSEVAVENVRRLDLHQAKRELRLSLRCGAAVVLTRAAAASAAARTASPAAVDHLVRAGYARPEQRKKTSRNTNILPPRRENFRRRERSEKHWPRDGRQSFGISSPAKKACAPRCAGTTPWGAVAAAGSASAWTESVCASR